MEQPQVADRVPCQPVHPLYQRVFGRAYFKRRATLFNWVYGVFALHIQELTGG